MVPCALGCLIGHLHRLSALRDDRRRRTSASPAPSSPARRYRIDWCRCARSCCCHRILMLEAFASRSPSCTFACATSRFVSVREPSALSLNGTDAGLSKRRRPRDAITGEIAFDMKLDRGRTCPRQWRSNETGSGTESASGIDLPIEPIARSRATSSGPILASMVKCALFGSITPSEASGPAVPEISTFCLSESAASLREKSKVRATLNPVTERSTCEI